MNVSGVTVVSMPSLTTVSSGLTISSMPHLLSVNLPQLMTVSSPYIAANPTLTMISGFGSLTQITTEFSIVSNPVLTQVTGFQALQSMGAFTVQNNTALTALGADLFSSSLHYLSGGFTISVQLLPSQLML